MKQKPKQPLMEGLPKNGSFTAYSPFIPQLTYDMAGFLWGFLVECNLTQRKVDL